MASWLDERIPRLSGSILLFGTPASADFQKGFDAYESGDYATALKEFRSLADKGDAGAQYNLGFAYQQGHERADVYRSRVEKLMTPAQLEKARQLVREAIAKNRRASPKPTKSATEQITAADYYKLGREYALRLDVTKDLTRTYMWWHIAASKGNEDALRGRDIIVEQMTSAQVEKALELASECVMKGYKYC